MSQERGGAEISRRDALRLASGAVALGAALGIPRTALAMAAEGRDAYEFTFKFWLAGKWLQSVPLTEEQGKLVAGDPGSLSIKLYRGAAEQLGALTLPTELQIKLRSFAGKVDRK